jgi:CheY-like chemotaxis protein
MMRTMRILVVEDHDAIRRMIEALVSARGHNVVSASNGAKAIEVVLSSIPDLVLLDLHLPGLFDGFEVCRRIRAHPETKDIPVVVISARDDEESRRKAREAGATAYYGKPFSPTALLKQIEKLQQAATRSPSRP